MATRRACGGCTACCHACAVTELNKPADTDCRFQTVNGCAIHNSRPDECRRYNCIWLTSPRMPESLRPDRSGFILDLRAAGERSFILVRELRERAANVPLAQEWITSCARQERAGVIYKKGDQIRRVDIPKEWEDWVDVKQIRLESC